MLGSGVPTTNAVNPGSVSLIAGPTSLSGSLSSHVPGSFVSDAGGFGAATLVLADELAAAVVLDGAGSTYFVTVGRGELEPEQALPSRTQLSVATSTPARRVTMIRP